jgi:hypothetical protein
VPTREASGERAVPRLAAALGAILLALGCAPSATQQRQHVVVERGEVPPPCSPGEASASPREPIDPASTFMGPNVEDRDGTPAYIHLTEHDMPLRVSIGYPKLAPRFGSREDGRIAAIDAIRLWESAIQPHLCWFRLEFVEKDESAAVQVIWKRRITGPYAGFGGLRYVVRDGRLWVGGEMQISTSPSGSAGLEARLRLAEIPFLVAHEFGHVLGLGHCLECDAAMNYSWATLGRVIVTDEDVRAFLALVDQPNGTRVDGRLMEILDLDADPAPRD